MGNKLCGSTPDEKVGTDHLDGKELKKGGGKVSIMGMHSQINQIQKCL